MTTTYVTYDTRSGQILSVHHGAQDSGHAREGARHHDDVKDEHVAVLAVPADAVEPGKQYKVDVGSKKLVATDLGVGFGFGAIGRSS